MPRKPSREVRVGALLLAAVAVAALAVFVLGERSGLFSRKNEYSIRFQNVGGLKAGNPVQLNGVEVGLVDRVILPERPEESEIEVRIRIDRRYADRVRGDSLARIKTLGLLGDKYVELTSGSPGSPAIASGHEIPAAPASSVDALLASGEDTMDNVVAISSSLRTILARMERGEGLLGQLTMNTPDGKRFSDSVVGTMETIERVAHKVDSGAGPLPRLLNDAEMTAKLSSTVDRLEAIAAAAEGGEGLLPSLLHDPDGKKRLDEVLANLSRASADLAGFTEGLPESEGLLVKLLQDEEYGRRVADDLARLLERLNAVADALAEGEGTAGRLIRDPAVYEAIQDVIVGIDDSRLLRWLIRNRQRQGIQQRYEAAGGPPGGPPPEAAEPPPQAIPRGGGR